LEIVGQLVAAYPHRFLSPGFAVRALLDKAMDDVIASSSKSNDERSLRVVKFLELRRMEQTVTQIAQWWGDEPGMCFADYWPEGYHPPYRAVADTQQGPSQRCSKHAKEDYGTKLRGEKTRRVISGEFRCNFGEF
jgi:hypothetical protein